MSKAMRQMPELSGRAGVANGEAGRYPAGDEACGTSHEHQGTGSATSSAGSGTCIPPSVALAKYKAATTRSIVRVHQKPMTRRSSIFYSVRNRN